MPSRINRKKRTKQRAEYLQKQEENKAKARERYKADPEKKKASVRESYKADPEKKKASVRESYIANIEPKRAAKRQRYGEDLEENRAAKRQRYGEDLEENRAAKRQRYGEDLEENRAVKRQRYQESVEENRAAKRRIYRGNSATIKAARMSRYWKGRRTTTTTTTTTQSYSLFEPNSRTLAEYGVSLEKAILRDSELLSDVNNAFCNSHPLLAQKVVTRSARAAYIMNSASNELFPSDEERYDKKLQCLYGLGTYCDPFGIPDQHWVDDVSKWPPVDYPRIYNCTYFIETPGGYTRERLKAFKSLEAYNFYQRLIVSQMISTST
ncbi:hypothetical protein EMCRGX_G022640 [Ephydatia muelleri]